MGVTVENGMYAERIEVLRHTPSKVRFVSFEPLLSDIKNADLTGIDWAIVGGESGFKARPIHEEWVANIQKACKNSNTLFYFKQWGGRNKKKSGRILQGRTWDDTPMNAKRPS
jgi:protein gp37